MVPYKYVKKNYLSVSHLNNFVTLQELAFGIAAQIPLGILLSLIKVPGFVFLLH